MKIRVPAGVTKDQFYVVLVLGVITGYYNWSGLLKNHIREHEKELQLNEAKNKTVTTKVRLSVVAAAGVFASVIGFKIYVVPWIRQRQAKKSEEFANFLYDQRKKKALQADKD